MQRSIIERQTKLCYHTDMVEAAQSAGMGHVGEIEAAEAHDLAEAEIEACGGWTPVVWMAFQDAADAAEPDATARDISGHMLQLTRDSGCTLWQYYKAKKEISAILAKWGLI